MLEGTMKEIELTQGKVAIVDDEDYEWLSRWKWYYGNGYAVRHSTRFLGRKHIFMHREILGTPDGMETDHINRDCLDNRRENLRACNGSQNRMNTSIPITNKSGYKGVVWNASRKKWQAQIGINYRRKYLGLYNTASAASDAYNKAALELFGEFVQK